MRLSFHGADRGVTGSCHMLEACGRRILVDCGLFQGSRELDEDNAADFGFEPDAVDFLLLTHAHLDHCGRIPLLANRGFKGEIVATAATRELTRLVLLDSAHLQEEEARYRARKPAHTHHGKVSQAPLYTMLDALNSLDGFGRPAVYGRRIELAPDLAATFFDAGHILGSASILVEAVEHGRRQRILFSGDIGSGGRMLLRDPQVPPDIDAVVMETTYGDRNHRPMADSVAELYEAIRDTRRRGGNVVIPTFALERTQDILFQLQRGIAAGELPRTLQVFLDSPMAISATEIFQRHPECYDNATAAFFHHGQDPLLLPGLHLVRETAESIALNQIRSGAIIMAGSGMCTGGRVRHHLRQVLPRAECSVIFVGFAAERTPARAIIDGARHVRLFGEDVAVKARIHTINGFSAHAGQHELLAWHARTGSATVTFLVHGETRSMDAFAKLLPGRRIEMPGLHGRYDL